MLLLAVLCIGSLNAQSQFIIQFGPNTAQGMGGSVYPDLMPTVENWVAVDSGTVVFPFTIQPAVGYEIDRVYIDNFPNTQAAQTGSYTFTHVVDNHTIFATFKRIMFTITATTDANGSINPGGYVEVAYGTSQTFQIIPNIGYDIAAVYVDGLPNAQAITTGMYTFTDITSNHAISATFTKKTYSITTIANMNGIIAPPNPTVQYGANQLFTFYPHTGYVVSEVLVDGIPNPLAVQEGGYTFYNVVEAHTIEVFFGRPMFTITASSTAGGTISPSGVDLVEYGMHSEVYVIDADPGYVIQSVLIDGENNTLAVYNMMHRFINVTTHHTIHAVFVPDSYTITAMASQGGAISPVGAVSVPKDGHQTFYFEPATGNKLVRVMIDGFDDPVAVQAGEYTFMEVTTEHTIAAQFEKITYNINYAGFVGAIIEAVPGYVSPVEHGATYKFTVKLEEGYTQSKITVRVNDIVINPLNGIYTINNITMNQVITIEGLDINQYTLISKTNTGGMVTPLGIFTVKHGETQVFDIIPNPTYRIKDVKVDGVSMGVIDSYIFDYVKADGKIEAFFEIAVNISGYSDDMIKVFSHNNVVTILNEQLVPIQQVEIMDMYGRLIWKGQALTEKTDITLNVATGIYGVRITTDGGQNITTKVIIN
jgi:hypothetical protein